MTPLASPSHFTQVSPLSLAAVAGRLSLRPEHFGQPIDFWLKNYLAEAPVLTKVGFSPEPCEGLLVSDLRIGHNSLFAGTGFFRACLFARMPPLRFWRVPTMMGVGLHMLPSAQESYDGTIEFELTAEDVGKSTRNLLFPVGRTQVAGRLVELVATRKLHEAIEKGGLRVELSFRPDVPEHQDVAAVTCSLSLIEGRLKPDGPIELEFGWSYKATFIGDGANEFEAVDVVGVMEV